MDQGVAAVGADLAGDGAKIRQQIVPLNRRRIEVAVEHVIPVVELETPIARELAQLVVREGVGRPVSKVRTQEQLAQAQENAVVDALEDEYQVLVAGGSGLAAGAAAVPEGARQVVAEARHALVDDLADVGRDIRR
jgi:hypothetical protein